MGARLRAAGWWRLKWDHNNRALATHEPPDAATLLEFTAAMLRAGVGIEACLQRLSLNVPGSEPLAQVHRTLTAGQGWENAWKSVTEDAELSKFGTELAFAYSTGAPTAELLELTAVQERARRRQRIDEQAARLGVQMVLPLGLCFLPAFILLGVIPVVLGLMQELA
ncbi:type II secretion system F family protein [Nesterenkonia halotolerans]|uniref:type II secretion system F family protein n=1 Tax=Nesterenkonia halotolerans TaxID=225325 RepID=UPI003EE4732D